MAAPRTPLRLSYRLSLTVAVVGLVLATGVAVALSNYRAGKANVAELSARLFGEVAERVASQTRGFLLQAPPVAEALRRLHEEEGGAALAPEALARRFVAVLRANPSFTWVSYSDASGAFVGAYRTPAGTLRVNLSAIVDGKTVLDEHDVAADGRWTPFRHADDTGYDPRTRPFYQAAAAAKRRVWTPPYVFFDQGVPGITCAEPVLGPGGEVRGVFTIDFDLNALSGFVRQLSFSANGRAFVTTADGTLLAHPTLEVVSAAGQGAEGALVGVADVADPALAAFVAAGGAGGFEAGGERYLAARREVAIDDGLVWTVGVYAPERDFTAALDRRVLISLVISLAAVALAALLATAIASRVAGPLVVLAEEMKEVGDFRLEGGREHRSLFREITLMAEALERMKGGLRSFASYVPRDLVRAVLASGRDARLAGELRELTIYFSDVAGFTSLAEKTTPNQLVEILGGYFDEMTKIIARHGGTVDKFLGDGIMAFWGAPLDEADHAALACEAALRCHRRLEELRAGGLELSARIGIATGEVLVGNIGSSERMNYTVMGDTANLASRIEGLSKQYGTAVLVSEATAAQARARIVLRPVDLVAVKGKAQGVRIYEVLGLVSEGDARVQAIAERSREALDAYVARDFARAIAAWDAVLVLAPDDGPARVMRARAVAYQAEPPAAGWDGVWVAKEK